MHFPRWRVSILIDYPESSVTDISPVEHPGRGEGWEAKPLTSWKGISVNSSQTPPCDVSQSIRD